MLVSLLLCGCSSSVYKEAETLFNEGAYEDAYALYAQIEETGGYKDSAEKMQECHYREADKAYENMDYAHAYSLYCQLGNYKDSEELSKQSGYALANLYAANENFQNAYSTFLELGDYKESASLSAECAKRLLSQAKVGSTVYMGSYEQDNNPENGKEPIAWIVLGKHNDYLLLLSEYVLDGIRFGYTNYWEKCDARSWLNSEFYQEAFTDSERALFQRMITSDKTDDLVFFLSAEETRGLFPSDESRIAYSTPYAAAVGVEEDATSWWTRSISTASNGKGVVEVEWNGNVRSAGCAPDVPNEYLSSYIGARPAICINITGTVTEKAENMSICGFDSSGDLDNEPNKWAGAGTGNGGSYGKCLICNGTGYVKYYYGSSDLEAWLSGHDAYTTGKCTSCNGTGKG